MQYYIRHTTYGRYGAHTMAVIIREYQEGDFGDVVEIVCDFSFFFTFFIFFLLYNIIIIILLLFFIVYRMLTKLIINLV